MKFIYAITETDVDGCGGMVREFVRCSRELSSSQLDTLQECLDETKRKVAETDEDVDTDDMISDALELFEQKTGICLEFTDDPVTEYLEF